MFATNCGMAVACSSALGAVYLRMPARWLTAIRAIPMAIGLSLLASLPWTAVMTLLVTSGYPTEWRQYSSWLFFHAFVLMTVWSGLFLWLVRSDWIPRTQARVLGADTLAPEAKPLDRKDADVAFRRNQGATPSSSTKSAAVPWKPEDRVGLQEGKRVRFCLVRDIACIRAAGDYTEVHLVSGEVATVVQRLRYWESQLPEPFVRIHRSTLINLELTEELAHVDGAWRVLLRGCAEPLTLSRRYAQAVRAKLDGRPATLPM